MLFSDSLKNKVPQFDGWGTLDALTDPIIVFHSESLILCHMNSAAARLTERSLIRSSSQEFVQSIMGLPERDLRAHLGELTSHESETVRLDVGLFGSQFDVSLQLAKGEFAEPVAIAVFRDVTGQLEADRQKRELVSNVSHELRSPLTAIKGAMGLILSGAAGEMPAKALQMVQICHRNADRLILIINDILDLDKITNGAMMFDNDHVQLVSLVNDAVEAIEGFKSRFDVTIDIDIVDSDMISFVDPNRMVQVLVNLLSNAIKFSSAGGHVTIRLMRHGDMNRMSVIDHGEGIATEDQERLFGRFVQIGAQNRASTGSTGLGLSIVKAIVNNQGGVISFKSRLGVGTTFHVDLPNAASEDNCRESDTGRLG
ncbi:sensor histidine kinase [Lentibacter sp. XHP0401]|uniref:sensor histidine kinase n=1 Tax=Lentibacter sp. XHP0401 TaxID=2984334 RepID=UPI0021E970AD|nr:ATP-binding protein [Lentibacter sp. XHP0401]MCV2894240.1 ATP-binding protein [Lentibacter sp. XHP0401]